MDSRVLFLGTGGDSLVVGKQYLASGGIIINAEDSQFHIDPGPGSLVMAKFFGVNLRENTALFLTKSQLFRANDINAVISAMTYDGLDKRGILVCPSYIASKHENSILNSDYQEFLDKTITLDNTKRIGINKIDIEVIELGEPANISCGYKFITKKFSIGYLPDTSYFDELGERYADTDILIISVTEPRELKSKEHLNSLDAEKIIKKAAPRLAIITGFGIKMFQAEPLYEAREIQKATGIQVIAAKDGMNINPVSFAATVRQKNLEN